MFSNFRLALSGSLLNSTTALLRVLLEAFTGCDYLFSVRPPFPIVSIASYPDRGVLSISIAIIVLEAWCQSSEESKCRK